jgi:uncharacterized protein (DUF305 family)
MNPGKHTVISLVGFAFLFSYAVAAEKEKSGMKHDDMDKMNMTPMVDMLKGKSGDEFEAAYLGMMIVHHKEGVKMANMALEKATSPQLKQMMEKTKSEQQADIDKMTGWLKEWYSKSPDEFSMPAESEQMMQKGMSELQGLSGAEFDKMFAKHMAHHHMDAIAMSKMAESKAKHAEVKKLASETVSSQTKEREKLMKMAKS